MDRESYCQTLYNKINERRGEELRVLGEICEEVAEISYRILRLHSHFKETDREVADCAETVGEEQEPD